MGVYAKAIQYVLLAVLGANGAAILMGGDFSDQNVIIGLIVTAVGAFAVFMTENTPEQPWAKQMVAILAAGVMVLQSAWTDQSISSQEWVQILLAVVAAWQVDKTKNAELH